MTAIIALQGRLRSRRDGQRRTTRSLLSALLDGAGKGRSLRQSVRMEQKERERASFVSSPRGQVPLSPDHPISKRARVFMRKCDEQRAGDL